MPHLAELVFCCIFYVKIIRCIVGLSVGDLWFIVQIHVYPQQDGGRNSKSCLGAFVNQEMILTLKSCVEVQNSEYDHQLLLFSV